MGVLGLCEGFERDLFGNVLAFLRIRFRMLPNWMPIDEAAKLLGAETITLRRAIERNAQRKPSGAVESRFDGVCARKLGRLWRVRLDPEWLNPFERNSAAAG